MGTTPQRPDDRSTTARFTAAYRDLSPRVLGYLRSHGVEDPESVTNEVFLALYQRFDDIGDGDDDVRALAFSIAHARIVDHSRSRARRPKLTEFEPKLDPRSAASAEQVVSERLGEHGVLPLLDALGTDQRDVVLLRIVGGLSLEETSQVMGKTVGSVKQLQRRALRSLRDALGVEGDDD